jgi:hypothetical protein
LGKEDSWVDPSDQLVDDQSWDVDQGFQSLDKTVGLTIETKDVVNFEDGCEFSEQETIGPSSSLFHEEFQVWWGISVSWGIDDEVSSVSSSWLIVNIVTQESVLDQVLVSLPTGWLLLHIDEFEESGEWCTLQGLVSVNTVASWKSLNETAPSLKGLEVCDSLLELVVLQHSDPPGGPATLGSI